MKKLCLLLLVCLLLASCQRINRNGSEPGSSEQTEPVTSTEKKTPNQIAILLICYVEDSGFAGRTRENLDVYVSCQNAKDLFCVGDEVFLIYSSEDCREEEKELLLPETEEAYVTHYHVVKAQADLFFEGIPVPEKPVIYLYPTVDTVVNVIVNFKGTFTETIPPYKDGWTVTASPDGTITDSDGNTYPYLFWEGIAEESLTFTEGFCVAGEDTEVFLTEALTTLGLNDRERTEFLAYWLPLMEKNPYNVISFLGAEYEAMAPMTVTPEPDSLLRVFMVFYASEDAVEIAPQILPPFLRHGFSVIEWGGCEIK